MSGLWRFIEDCRARGVQITTTSHSFDFPGALNRRAAEGQIAGSDVSIVKLRSDGSGNTNFDRIAPNQVHGFEGRIIRSLADDRTRYPSSVTRTGGRSRTGKSVETRLPSAD